MLTIRQQTILRLVVGDYIRTATPVGSKIFAETHKLGLSPATIRKEIGELEEAGYTTRPHTSAGSIPLDNAYRLYVESLLTKGTSRIPESARWSVREQLYKVESDLDEWAAAAAAILARLVGNMAVATFPKARESRVRHLELVRLQDELAMLIVVLEQASLKRQLIRLRYSMRQSDLEASTNRVKTNTVGLTRREIEARDMELTPIEEELVDATILMLKEEDHVSYPGHYVDGLRNLLSQPEFSEHRKVRDLVEGVEDGSLVQAILAETPDGGVVRVIIGQEHRGDTLWPLSVVICQYGIPNEATGAVGAIGPTRMEYSKTIAGVQLMSSIMSDLVQGVRKS